MNCFCDKNVSEIENNLNKTKPLITELNLNKPINNSSNYLMSRIDRLGKIRITYGFLMRTLFVVTVISMSISLFWIIRMFYSRKRRLIESRKYNSLPTSAFNEKNPIINSEKPLIFHDSEDDEFTIFDASHRLIK